MEQVTLVIDRILTSASASYADFWKKKTIEMKKKKVRKKIYLNKLNNRLFKKNGNTNKNDALI